MYNIAQKIVSSSQRSGLYYMTQHLGLVSQRTSTYCILRIIYSMWTSINFIVCLQHIAPKGTEIMYFLNVIKFTSMSPQSTIHFAFLSMQGYIFVKQHISTYKRYFRQISRSPDIFTTEISISIYFIQIFLIAKQNIFQIIFLSVQRYLFTF